jgi:hypothetical protein
MRIGDNEKVAKKAVEDDRINGSFLLRSTKERLRALIMVFIAVGINFTQNA